MPLMGKEVVDLEYPTGFATSPGQAAVAGGAAVGKPFTAAPFLPPDRYGILDITVNPATGALTPAALGKLMVMQSVTNPFVNSGAAAVSLAANNTTLGGGFWAQAGQNGLGLAGASLSESTVGIVEQVGPPNFPNTSPLQYPRATIVVRGPVQALCVAPTTGNAIAVGTPLCSDGAGNLQPLPLPAAAPTITTGIPFGISTTSACPAWALVAVSANGTYSAIGANFGASTPVSLGNTVAGIASSPNGILLEWTPTAMDAVGYIVLRTASTGLSQTGTPNQLGVIGYVPNGENYFIDYGQIPLSGTSATQAFARPAAGGTPTVTQVTTALSGPASVAYKITAILPNGVWGTEGANGSTTTSPAQIVPSAGNKIVWTGTAGAAFYAIDRTTALSVTNAGSTTGFIGFASSLASVNGFVDYGQAATTFSTAVVTTPAPTAGGGVAVAFAMGSLAAATSIATLVPVYQGSI